MSSATEERVSQGWAAYPKLGVAAGSRIDRYYHAGHRRTHPRVSAGVWAMCLSGIDDLLTYHYLGCRNISFH
jgi:hypothetical protein